MFKNKYYNISYFFLFIFLIITYFSKIYYKLDDVDEINYLSDSLLLLEGELPSSKHAPGGLKTWFGTAFVFIDFLFNIINDEYPNNCIISLIVFGTFVHFIKSLCVLSFVVLHISTRFPFTLNAAIIWSINL